VRAVPLETATETCTFGSALRLADDVAISRALSDGSWPRSTLPELSRAMLRDMALTDHRWRAGERRQSGPFVPGDVLRLRVLAGTWLLKLRDPQQRDSMLSTEYSGPGAIPEPYEPEREDAMLRLLYGAMPYFLPASAAYGIMASQPPEVELLAELRLPYPAVAVFFAAEFDVPPELQGGEEILRSRERGGPTLAQALAGEAPWENQAPTFIRFPTLSAMRGEAMAVVGVVLTSTESGELGDLVLFVLSKPRPGGARFSVVEGLLRRSRLRPLVENLAAAVAWGDWKPPAGGFELPADSDSSAFRRAINRGAFRRQEPHGVFGGIRVLDAPKMFRPRAESEAEESGVRPSPATHLRRGHWRRQRVGPRDSWRYEPRFIAPVVVNPGAGRSDGVKVYRLPLPGGPRGGQ